MAGLNLGNSILNLLGQPDPRQQLTTSLLGGTAPQPGGAAVPPVAGAAAPGATPAGPGTPPPAAPVAQAYQSPPDLLNLYSTLLDRSQREDRIDKGISLIAAGFAQPENRAALIQAASGSGGSSNPNDYLSNIMSIRQNMVAQQTRADMLKQLPVIAQKYGLSLEEANMLFQNDQLDDFISEQNKKNLTTMADGSGQLVTIDQNTGGAVGSPVGSSKPRETKVVTDAATGNQKLVYSDTGEEVRNLGGGLAPTTNMQEYNTAVAQGYKGTLEDWQKEMKKAGANSVTVNNAGAPKVADEFAKTWVDDYNSAKGAISTMQSIGNARASLDAPGGIITGSSISPYTAEGRKVLAGIFGIDDKATTNTDAFKSALRDVVRAQIHDLGSGNSITDADRKFMEEAVGASGTLTEASVRRILSIMEKGQRRMAQQYNANVDNYINELKASGADVTGIQAAMRKVAVPEFSEGYLNDLKAAYPPEAIATLLKDPSPEAQREFNEAFQSPDAARDILEAFGGQ